MKRWVAAVLTAAGCARLTAAADLKWRGSAAVLGLYSENVYFTPDGSQNQAGGSQDKPTSSAGGSFTAEVRLTSVTPRSELSLGYKPSYRYYSSQAKASNVQHFLTARWKTNLDANSTFSVDEGAIYTPEADNFQDRGVDKAFTAGPRVRQVTSTTSLGTSTRISPRWNLNADYAYRILGYSGPPLVAPDGDGTRGSTQVGTALFNEEGHIVGLGSSHQLTPASSIGARAGYTLNRFEPDLFASPSLQTSSLGVSVFYNWLAGQRVNFTAGVGGYRTRDRSGRAADVSIPTRTTNDFSADLTLVRTYASSSLAAGVNRGLSTFDGLGRSVTVDRNHDGTLDDSDGDGTVDLVSEPLGSATRTTLYGSYAHTFGLKSNLSLAVNGTRREEAGGGGVLNTIGTGASYGFRFAPWGGLIASYNYARQTASGDAAFTRGRKFKNNSAQIGLFVSTR